MSGQPLRVAYFPDTYDEIDGVANTSRQFEAFARRHGLPFLTVHGGADDVFESNGSTTRMKCQRGRVGFPLDKQHNFDLAFWRYMGSVEEVVRKFAPDIVHITGPSDVGQLGAMIAYRLGIPLAASWHTNLHEYAERRAAGYFRFLPARMQTPVGKAIREASLYTILRFYRTARVLFAPNQELIDLMEKGTGKRCHPMVRGVDAELFHPGRRERSDDAFVVGFVGRLSVEKNIRDLAAIEQHLIAAGVTNYLFRIVGQGAEEAWLRTNMRRAELTGVLGGEALARAYAGMDVLAFPSQTDTYGNVVLEALASGVPAVVTNAGGPRFIVRNGESGIVASNLDEFCDAVLHLALRPVKLERMRLAARARALELSWDAAFEAVYAGYEQSLRAESNVSTKARTRPVPSRAMARQGASQASHDIR